MEPMTGIEPAYSAWEAGDLISPIGNGFYSYARKWDIDPGRTRAQQEDFLLSQQIAAVRFWIARRAARDSR
jgi:hypothetical protein